MKAGLFGLTIIVGWCVVGCQSGESSQSAQSGQDTKKVTTGGYAAVDAIFKSNCVSCHGGMGPGRGGIELTSYASLMKGGREGAIVVAGDPSGSALVQALRGQNGKQQMPKGHPPLTDDQIKTIEDWIKAGAKS